MLFGKRGKARRTPLDAAPLRTPGQSLQEMLFDGVMSIVVFWGMLAILAMVNAVQEWLRFLLRVPPAPWVYTIIALAVGILAFIKIRSRFPGLLNLRLGIQGERAVGQALEELRTRGYKVLHDVPGDGFNVDHVLVGPAGVFVVETKTVSKPMRGETVVQYDGERILINGHSPDRDPIVQTKATFNTTTLH